MRRWINLLALASAATSMESIVVRRERERERLVSAEAYLLHGFFFPRRRRFGGGLTDYHRPGEWRTE